MEDILYKALKTFIAANPTPITNKGLVAPIEQAWWETQVENALKQKDNETHPFDIPALFYQFEPTKYRTENNGRVTANGIVIIHLVQDKIGKDGKHNAETEAAYNLALQYAGVLVSMLHGVKQTCAAVLRLSTIERDHSNNPLMHERIIFDWTATKKITAF